MRAWNPLALADALAERGVERALIMRVPPNGETPLPTDAVRRIEIRFVTAQPSPVS